jgi:hypothetical protein
VRKYLDNEGSTMFCYECPYCRCSNNKNIEIFTRKEIITLVRQDLLDAFIERDTRREYKKRISQLEEENSILYKIKKNKNKSDIIQLLENAIEYLKKTNRELVEIQYENIKIKKELFGLKANMRDLKVENLLLKQEKNKDIDDYNNLIIKMNEMTNTYNTTIDETTKLINNRKYKQLKKMYSEQNIALKKNTDILPKENIPLEVYVEK